MGIILQQLYTKLINLNFFLVPLVSAGLVYWIAKKISLLGFFVDLVKQIISFSELQLTYQVRHNCPRSSFLRGLQL